MSKKKQESKRLYRTLSEQMQEKIEFVPTGSTLLDLSLGGGVAKGKVIQVYGSEATGKTLLSESAAAIAQTMNMKVALVDAEASFDKFRAVKIFGIDATKMIFTDEIDTIEELYELTEDLLDTKKEHFIILDSLDAIDVESSVEEKGLGTMRSDLNKPRQMKKIFKKIVRRLKKTNSVLFIISHAVDNIGVMYGDKKTTAGGSAVRFYSSQRIYCSVKEKLKNKNKQPIGVLLRIQNKKNKVYTPFKECIVYVYFNKGINDLEGNYEYLKQNTKFFGSKGLTYKERTFESRDEILEFLSTNPKRVEKVKQEVIKVWHELEDEA